MEFSQGWTWLVVVCLVKLVLFATSLNITTVHYIVPAQSSCPDGRECTDIGTLLNESERYFTSNTRVVFQPGTYIIDLLINKSVLVYNVTNLVITGDNTEQPTYLKATLHCEVEFNIIIIQSESIHIDNLELLECGASIDFYSQVRFSMYNHIKWSDTFRADITFREQHAHLIPAKFATIYILYCINVTVENTSIEQLQRGVTLLVVNIRDLFKVAGCSFKGIYRSWFIDDLVDGKEIEIFYNIKNSHFFSKVLGSNEPPQQEAVTVIVSRAKVPDWKIKLNLAVENTTIQGKSGVKQGYIFKVILNTPFFDFILNRLNSYNGKQLIDVSYKPLSSAPVQIKVLEAVFKGGSNLEIDSYQYEFANIKLIIVIENLLISDAVDALYIPRCTAYLRNVTIEGTASTGIQLIQTNAFFEGSNKISWCYAAKNLDSLLQKFGFNAVFTGGLYSINSTVTIRGEMYFNSNYGDDNGAVTAHSSSTFIFEGKIIFTDNTGYNGGAIGLYDNSLIIINNTATVSFIRNHAHSYGGATYVHDKDLVGKNTIVQCFYKPAIWNDSIDYHVLNYVNNTAIQAGDSLFAANGEYDRCKFPNNIITTIQNFPFNAFTNTLQSYSSNISAFASQAKRVCFCTDSRPNCTYVRELKEVYPGQDIQLSVVAVGIGYGTVPATVRARIHNIQQSSTSQSHLLKLQGTQETTKYCTGLNYTIYSNPGTQAVLLSLDQIVLANALYHIQQYTEHPLYYDPSELDHEVPLLISLSVNECPAGFQLSQETQSCVCHFKLRMNNIGCNINDQTVFRQQSHWLGAVYDDSQNESDVVVYKHCPFDYCKPKSMNLRLDNQDEQCSNQRSGVLCGQCQGNLSIVLGTTRCMECSHIWILLILPLSILAGVILVVILTLLNLTVAIGTINGLIFYANIVQTNKAVLFPSLTENIAHLSQFCKTFIAWLNLDLGIEVCFYKGLDTYAKALFQFVFPLYIWTIMIIIIVSSHYSTRMAKLTGRNAVQVLATLFLLSYSKILRGIITALSVTTLNYPDESRLVWLHDGNMDYLKGSHIFLFILALFLLTVLSVPYTSILLFSQCLQRWSNYKLISWIWKVKPLFDAYTGPYKDKHRYWTGLLLLVRVVLYIVYSTNVGGDPAVNLLATCITVICVLTYLVLAGGVYKSWPLTILECSYLLNISVLMTVALYFRSTGSKQDILSNISVMISFLLACGTVVYHVYLRIKETRLVKRYVRNKEQNSQRNEQLAEGEGLVELQEATKKETSLPTSQEFYFDKLLNQPLLEERQTSQQ